MRHYSALAIVDGVTKTFHKKDKPALHSISTSIMPGKMTGIVGPDGAGKTTLIRLLMGLLHPTSGTITINGLDTVTQAGKIHKIAGYMPQKFGLYEDLSVIENLELYATLRGVEGQKRKEKFKVLLAFTALEPFKARLAGQLSGGMKQKLGLACALIGTPKLLLLDEPSVGVDPISRRELWAMVRQLVDEGTAVVWSTSYLDEAQQCDTVILLEEGRKLHDGPPADLLKRVEGRTWHIGGVKESERRHELAKLLNQSGVIDGIIQGRYVRIVTKDKKFRPVLGKGRPLSKLAPVRQMQGAHGAENPKCTFGVHEDSSTGATKQLAAGVEFRKGPGEKLIKVAPVFEDAFIDILGGGPGAKSKLAATMIAKPACTVPVIEAMNLTKKFGNFTAVKNISFAINRGEIFGLLGPNGAGKSTTFKMLCGLLAPTSGSSLITCERLNARTSRGKSRIGYMAQKFSLYGNLNITQNMKFFSGIYGLSGSHQRQAIALLVELFALEPYLKLRSDELPLGIKQRLALSCSVMHMPDILFLDEPTSGVDPITRREFWMHINALAEKGMTIMITTHFMDEAEYCDRIALVYRGENIAIGAPDDLKETVRDKMDNPTLEDAFIEILRRYDAKMGEPVSV